AASLTSLLRGFALSKTVPVRKRGLPEGCGARLLHPTVATRFGSGDVMTRAISEADTMPSTLDELVARDIPRHEVTAELPLARAHQGDDLGLELRRERPALPSACPIPLRLLPHSDSLHVGSRPHLSCLPVGGKSSREPEVGENPSDDAWVIDGGHQAHAAATAGTGQHVHRERARKRSGHDYLRGAGGGGGSVVDPGSRPAAFPGIRTSPPPGRRRRCLSGGPDIR